MQSIRELYKIGHGPSSSHSMAPRRAAEEFRQRTPRASAYRVSLYGSLAATGKGHLTDRMIAEVFAGQETAFEWHPDEELGDRPNGMRFEALDGCGVRTDVWQGWSIGGGDLLEHSHTAPVGKIYPAATMRKVLRSCDSGGRTLWEYAGHHEGDDIWDHLHVVWKTMLASLRRGLETEGTLPGSIHLARKASSYHTKATNSRGYLQKTGRAFAYALAVAEENAAGGEVVTAPTCGSAGVVPAAIYFLAKTYKVTEPKILHALATAGLIGNLVKNNASISGAEVGCQGEVGTACAMAAGAATQILGGTPHQVEYAAEMGLEHHLGLTCDPVDGLVQIPCIERNAVAAVTALDCAAYVLLSDGRHRIGFDEVVQAMAQTGRDLDRSYRETACGGLAVFHRKGSG